MFSKEQCLDRRALVIRGQVTGAFHGYQISLPLTHSLALWTHGKSGHDSSHRSYALLSHMDPHSPRLIWLWSVPTLILSLHSDTIFWGISHFLEIWSRLFLHETGVTLFSLSAIICQIHCLWLTKYTIHCHGMPLALLLIGKLILPHSAATSLVHGIHLSFHVPHHLEALIREFSDLWELFIEQGVASNAGLDHVLQDGPYALWADQQDMLFLF